ncbi:MAG TPA: hypothetical protein VLB04_12400 [Methanotrichaceae archaeon]|nr:hypothetical protein [Methanotrichaceae archaeon]
MDNDTRNKLDETRYFLLRLKEAYNNYITNNSEKTYKIVGYNFNAFLSAARSITYFMQKQYKQSKGFPEWYCRQQLEMKADSELECLNIARVGYIHKRPVQLGNIQRLNFEYRQEWDPSDPLKDPIIKNTVSTQVIELFLPKCKHLKEDKNLLDFCESQLNKLKQIVDECERNFLKL